MFSGKKSSEWIWNIYTIWNYAEHPSTKCETLSVTPISMSRVSKTMEWSTETLTRRNVWAVIDFITTPTHTVTRINTHGTLYPNATSHQYIMISSVVTACTIQMVEGYLKVSAVSFDSLADQYFARKRKKQNKISKLYLPLFDICW